MKILSSLAIFYLFTMIMSLASMVMAIAVKPVDLSVMDIIIDMKLLYSGLFLVGLVFMSIGFLISVLIKHLRLAMPLIIGIFFVSYLLGTFSSMIEQLEFLKYFSPFHYAVPSEIIKNGFEQINILLSFAIIVITITGTYHIYRKKDFRL